MKTLFALVASLAIGGCSSTPGPTHSGASPEASSPKPHDFAPGDGDSYVHNPSVKLSREYWTVLRTEEGRYALLPRPDGAPAIAAECATDSADARRFRQNRLCRSADSEEAVKAVNSLSREDAMAVSSWLHQRLEFRRVAGSVEPYPLTTDLLEVCERFPAERAGALRRVCDMEMSWAKQGARPDIAMVWNEAELQAMPAALNRLYGIETSAH